jgi:hypothetical protein
MPRRAGIELAPLALVVSVFNLGVYTSVRVELRALSPRGPYRLTVHHPAKKIVEYFDTPFAALLRHAEIESTLTGRPSTATSPN